VRARGEGGGVRLGGDRLDGCEKQQDGEDEQKSAHGRRLRFSWLMGLFKTFNHKGHKEHKG